MSSIVEIYRRFPTPESATAHLEKVRWGESPACPYCGSDKAARHNETSRQRWQCWRCNKSFSVTVGTIFHNSHIDLQRWFLLISLMLNAKKGLSAMQAARDLDMRRPTVWSMMHRVRKALVDDGQLLRGLVEMDEAYVGGKPRKRNRRDDDIDAPRGRASRKQPVVGAVERGGRLKAKAVNKAEMAADTIESVWAILKRALIGQFHHVSANRRMWNSEFTESAKTAKCGGENSYCYSHSARRPARLSGTGLCPMPWIKSPQAMAARCSAPQG